MTFQLCQAMFRLQFLRLLRRKDNRLSCSRAFFRSFPCPLTPYVLSLPSVLVVDRAAAVVVAAVNVLRLAVVFVSPHNIAAPLAALAVGLACDPALQAGTVEELHLGLHTVVVHRSGRRKKFLRNFQKGLDKSK